MRVAVSTFETALITGGSTGIGFSLAKKLAESGTRVAICARRREVLEQAKTVLGASALIFEADVSDPERAMEVVDESHRALGGLDLVIANAGFSRNSPIH